MTRYSLEGRTLLLAKSLISEADGGRSGHRTPTKTRRFPNRGLGCTRVQPPARRRFAQNSFTTGERQPSAGLENWVCAHKGAPETPFQEVFKAILDPSDGRDAEGLCGGQNIRRLRVARPSPDLNGGGDATTDLRSSCPTSWGAFHINHPSPGRTLPGTVGIFPRHPRGVGGWGGPLAARPPPQHVAKALPRQRANEIALGFFGFFFF